MTAFDLRLKQSFAICREVEAANTLHSRFIFTAYFSG